MIVGVGGEFWVVNVKISENVYGNNMKGNKSEEIYYKYKVMFCLKTNIVDNTPGLHNKIPPHKIFARVWVAQEPICS